MQAMGAACQLYAFDCPAELAWQRVAQRNAQAPADSLRVDQAAFWHFASRLEALAADEPAVRVTG